MEQKFNVRWYAKFLRAVWWYPQFWVTIWWYAVEKRLGTPALEQS